MTCATCGELPDDVWANTGRDQHLPDASRRLKSPWPHASGIDALLCPACGAWFVWRDHPQFYGSGNLDEEQLTRLPPHTWRTLERLLHGELDPDPDLVMRDAFTHVPSDLLRAVVGNMGDTALLRVAPSFVERLFLGGQAEADAAAVLFNTRWRPGMDERLVQLLEAAPSPLPSKRVEYLLEQCRAALAKKRGG
jgi:hypothetical protein